MCIINTLAVSFYYTFKNVNLFQFGFFKRRKGGKEVVAEDDEFDQFDTNPFGGRSGSARAIPGTKPPPADPELLKYEEKGKEE